MDFYLLTNEPNLALRRVYSRTDRRPLGVPTLVVGATETVNLYLIDESGAYTSASGSASKAPRLVLGTPGMDVPLVTIEPASFTALLDGATRIGWTCSLPLTAAALAEWISGYAQRATFLEFNLTDLSSGVEVAGTLVPVFRAEVTLLPSAYNAGTTYPSYADLVNATAANATAIQSRPDITGLGVSAPGSGKLASLSSAALALLENGAQVRLVLSGQICADYQLGLKGADSESTPFLVVCDNASTRCFRLLQVTKQGVPCAWDATLSKFRQLLVAGDSPALADAADAFVIPD